MGREDNKVESSGSRRSGLLTAAGILTIVVGSFEAIGGGIMVGSAIAHRELFGPVGHGLWGGIPGIFLGPFGALDLIWLIIVGVPYFALGIVAIVGGVSALTRKSFGLSLAGGICALPSWFLGGILAVVFVLLSKKEFEVEGSSGMRGV